MKKQEQKLNRRRLLAAGIAAAVALGTFAQIAAAQSPGVPCVPGPTPVVVPFREPPVVSSVNGVLKYTLNVVGKIITVMGPNGEQKELVRTYDGMFPGPTFKIRRGDRMALKIVNKLPKDKCNPANLDFCCTEDEDSVCCDDFDVNKPHCFNTTNLHTHGLHVSPASFLDANGELIASDDVLLHIHPGHAQKYCIDVPKFHAPGSFWYHAHKHGATALQLLNGLCGALILEEDDDEKILKDGQVDRVWIMQEVMQGPASSVYTCFPPDTSFIINGVCQPTLVMRPGEVQRWRFVNATSTPRGVSSIELLDAAGNQIPMHLIAVDGITFYGKPPRPTLGWELTPGGRADFLVQIPPTGTAGVYRVHKNVVAGAPASAPQVLAYVVVQGPVVLDQIPAVLPKRPDYACYLEPIHLDMPPARTVSFSVEGACGAPGDLIGTDFLIDGEKFDPTVVDHAVPLGATEEWALLNTSGMRHPFHIHVNSFQVVGEVVDPTGPDDPTNWMWRDTVPIPAVGQGGQVNIRHRFLDYDGLFVLHCHVLNHEDLGMMQLVKVGNPVIDPETGARISGDGVGPCEPLSDCEF